MDYSFVGTIAKIVSHSRKLNQIGNAEVMMMCINRELDDSINPVLPQYPLNY